MRPAGLAGVALLLATPWSAGPATAQSTTWTGAVSNIYGAAVNWNPGFTPNNTNRSAVFSDGGINTNVKVNVDVTVRNWTLSGTTTSYSIFGSGVTFAGNLSNTSSVAQSIANNLGGVAAVSQNGAGTLTLSGTNTYTGETTITAGILQANTSTSVSTTNVNLNGGTFQAGANNLTFSNNFGLGSAGGIIDNANQRLTLSGVISDGSLSPGSLTLSGGFPTGVTIVTGNNTYTGGTVISNTTVQVGNANALGTSLITLTDGVVRAGSSGPLTLTNTFAVDDTPGGGLIDNNGRVLTLSGNITDGNGPGAVTFVNSNVNGSGRTILQGTNTYTGGTTVCSCALVQLGDATHTSSLVGAITVEGELDILRADTTQITQITNSGQLLFANNSTAATMTIQNLLGGRVQFNNTSTAGAATITNGSFLSFQNHSTAGSATIDTSFVLTFVDNSSAGSATIRNTATPYISQVVFYDQATAGSAQITNSGTSGFRAAFLSFIGGSSAGNATIVNNAFGRTDFGTSFGTDAPTADNATITNNANGVTAFNAFSTAGNATITTESGGVTLFFDNSTGDTARLIAQGTGIVDFSGSVGPNSDGRIAAGSIEGSGTFYIGAGNTLVVGGNNLTTEVSGLVADFDPCGCGTAGPGALEKVGTGTLTLSGVNTYTGGTTLVAGAVSVSQEENLGDVAGALTFNGGVLQITGTTFTATARDINWLAGGGGFDIADSNNTFTVTQTLTGGGPLTKLGAGTLVLSGANTYSGGTLISAGVLVVDNSTPGVSSSVGTGRVTLDGGTFQAGAGGLEFSNPFAINTPGGTIDTNGNILTLSGVIADGDGPGALTVAGGGILTLTAANTYSGGTTISGAFLQLGDATHTASILGPVTNNGNFDIVNADLSGVTQVTNNGFVTFFNANSAASVHIDNDGGTTTFLDTSTAGTATILNRNGGITRFGVSGGTETATAGSANITNQDTDSATVFVARTTAGQATIVNTTGGITSFAEQSNAGTATITNRDGGATVFADTASAASATIVNRDGSFEAPSATAFTGTSSAGSATITNMTGGTTGFVGNATAASATIVNRDGIDDLPSTTAFAGSSTAGNAIITNQNFGVVIFSQNSTGANATIINNMGGGAAFGAMPGDTTSASNATITNNAGGVTAFNQFSTAADATIITNANGFTLFTNNSTSGNAQLITNAGGVVDFSATTGLAGDGRITAGSIAGAGDYYLGGNRLTVGSNNRSTEVSGTINDGDGPIACGCGATGATGASLVKVGTGTLILSGTNTYTGGTTIGAGMLQIGNGGTTGSILGNVVNNSILAFNRSDTYAFDGVISGTGALQQNGPGRTILTAVSTYTGATLVNAGTLSVNGSIAASRGLTVSAGGIVAGNGTLPSTIINGGTLAPGNSIGTLTVSGSLTFAAGSTYAVEVSPVASDTTNVTGVATLAGNVQAMFMPGTFLERTYTILTAGQRNSTFNTLATTNLPAGFIASLSYTGTTAVLNLTAVLGLPPDQPTTPEQPTTPATATLPPGGLNVNQRNVATSLNTFFNNGGALPPNFVTVFGLTGQSLGTGLTQLSGQIGTGAARASQQDMGQFLELMLDPFLENRVSGSGLPFGGPALAFAPGQAEAAAPEGLMAYGRMVTKAPPAAALYDPRWSTWGAAFGATGSFDGNAAVGSRDITTRSGGFAGGIDYRPSPNTVLGFAASGSSLSYYLDSGFGTGRGDVFKAGVYASTRLDNAYLSASAAFGAYDLTTSRNVLLPGFSDRLNADFSAHSFGGRIEAGYRFAWMGSSGITPYAAFQAQSFHTPNYSEADATGLAGFALTYGANTTNEGHSELGARFDSRFALTDNSILLVRGRLGWAHQFYGDPSINAAFQQLAGAGFTVFGEPLARDALLVSAGPELRFANGWSLRAKFDGAFSGETQVYAGTGTLRYTW